MDARVELEVTVLLIDQRQRGDTTADHRARRCADRFWGADLPGRR
jgi:hypothetical protein